MFSSITGILKVSHISTSCEPKNNLLPSFRPDKKCVIEFVIQEIGGAEGDRWQCRKLFYVVPLKTQNMCCRMNCCMGHAFLTQVMCFAGLYQSVMAQKRLREQLGISLVSSEIQKRYRMMWITRDVKHQ